MTLRLLEAETPPSNPLLRVLHRNIKASLKVDARTYIRLCVLAGRSR